MAWMKVVHQVREEARSGVIDPNIYMDFCSTYEPEFSRKLCDIAYNPRQLPTVPIKVGFYDDPCPHWYIVTRNTLWTMFKDLGMLIQIWE